MSSRFRELATARFLFTFAVEMQGILLGWRMYELTHSTFYLGLIGLAEAIPAIGLALYAGYLVDRSRPIGIFRGVLIGSVLSGLVLHVSQIPALHVSDTHQVAALFAASFIAGCARSFSQPSMYAILPRIIERKDLSLASARMTTVMQFARVSGPAAGGYFLHLFGMATSSAIVCGLLILAFGAVLLIPNTIEPAPASAQPGSKIQELLSGAVFVYHHPILLPALSLDMISVLFGGVTGLLPVFAKDILLTNADGLGALKSASAVGAALMSLWLSRRGIREGAGKALIAAVTGFGVCVLVFGLSRNFYLSLAMLGLSGAFDSISVIVRSTAVQLASPDELRGRISAVNSIFIGSSNEIGEFESGVAASIMGTVNSVLFGGTICILTVLITAMRFPALRNLDLGKLEAAHFKPDAQPPSPREGADAGTPARGEGQAPNSM